MEIFDTHVHSTYSPDGKQTPDQICQEAVEKKLTGIALTEHVNARNFDLQNTDQRFQEMHRDLLRVQKEYEGRLKIFSGVEFGEFLEEPEKCQRIYDLGWHDVVLGSVHSICPGIPGFTGYKVDKSVSDEDLRQLLLLYYQTMNNIIDQTNFDILTHITLPLRYLHRKYNRPTSWTVVEKPIVEILKKVVDKDLALEINSNGWTDEAGYHSLPEKDIVQIYYDFGGRRVTLGSDAHQCGSLARNFDDHVQLLRDVGLKGYYYFEKRQPVFVPLDEE